jgi:hypothetical protein
VFDIAAVSAVVLLTITSAPYAIFARTISPDPFTVRTLPFAVIPVEVELS